MDKPTSVSYKELLSIDNSDQITYRAYKLDHK